MDVVSQLAVFGASTSVVDAQGRTAEDVAPPENRAFVAALLHNPPRGAGVPTDENIVQSARGTCLSSVWTAGWLAGWRGGGGGGCVLRAGLFLRCCARCVLTNACVVWLRPSAHPPHISQT